MTYSAIRLSGAANDGKSIRQAIDMGVLPAVHGFTAGDVIRYDPGTGGGTGAYVKAQADTAYNSEAIGVVETLASNGESVIVVYGGEIDLSEFPASVASANDDVFFLSAATAGFLTSDPPTSGGEVIKPVLTRTESPRGIVTNYIGTSIGGKSTVSLSSVQPVGQIVPWAGAMASSIPDGWDLCDGHTLDVTDYSELYDSLKGPDTHNGYGVADPRIHAPSGTATRFGWQQSIVLSAIPNTIPVVGDVIYQGITSGSGDILDGDRVVGQVLAWDQESFTLTVGVTGEATKHNNVAGTTTSRQVSSERMFGTWTPDGAAGATLSLNDTTDGAGGSQSIVIANATITHIRVPDLRGRFVIGRGFVGQGGAIHGDYGVGDHGGEEQHVMTEGEMFRHNHPTSQRYWRDDNSGEEGFLSTGSHDFTHNSNVEAQGRDLPITNMPPWMGLRYIIRVSSTAQAAILDDITVFQSMSDLLDTKLTYGHDGDGAGSSFGDILVYENDAEGGTFGWYNRQPLIRNLATNSNENLVFYTSQNAGDTLGIARWALDQTYGTLFDYNADGSEPEGITGIDWGGADRTPQIQIQPGPGPVIYTSGRGDYTSASFTTLVFDSDQTGLGTFRINSQGLMGGGWQHTEPLGVHWAHGRSAEAHMRIESGNVTGGGADAGYIGFNVSIAPSVPFQFNVPWNADASMRLGATSDRASDLQFYTYEPATLTDNLRGGIFSPRGMSGGSSVGATSESSLSVYTQYGRDAGTLISLGGISGSQVFVGVTAGGGGAGAINGLTPTLNVVSTATTGTTGAGLHSTEIASFVQGKGGWGVNSDHTWNASAGRVFVWSAPGSGANGIPGGIGTNNAKAFGIKSNGIARIRVHYDGNVHIGKNAENFTAVDPLSVQATSVSETIVRLIGYTGDHATGIYSGPLASGIGTITSSPFNLKTSGQNRLIITSAGKIGIGLNTGEYSSSLLSVGPLGATATGMYHGDVHGLVNVSPLGMNVAMESESYYSAGFSNIASGGAGVTYEICTILIFIGCWYQ